MTIEEVLNHHLEAFVKAHVKMGTDTFVVKEGKIGVQTFAMYIG